MATRRRPFPLPFQPRRLLSRHPIQPCRPRRHPASPPRKSSPDPAMSSAPPAQQSKPSYHRRHPNSGPRQQQRYVPKSAAPPAPKPSPPPSLTTALRSWAAPSASGAGGSSSADGFVAYLPHDEAVAAGLGGLDAQESQVVVDHLKDALASLLRTKPREF